MIVRPSISGPHPEEDGSYLISALLDEAIAFAQRLGGYRYAVDLTGIDPYDVVTFCEAEFGPDGVYGERDKRWRIEPTLMWTWNTSGVFYFSNEDDATAVALRFK